MAGVEPWEDVTSPLTIVNGTVDNFNKIFIKNSRPRACRGFAPCPADMLTRDEGSTQVDSPVHNTADALLSTASSQIFVRCPRFTEMACILSMRIIKRKAGGDCTKGVLLGISYCEQKNGRLYDFAM
jgi:hypothetical protein